MEGRIEVTRRWGRGRKQLLYDMKVKRGYWKLKKKALDRTLWRTRFGRGYGPVVRQKTEFATLPKHVKQSVSRNNSFAHYTE
jgi:hypothetical protein